MGQETQDDTTQEKKNATTGRTASDAGWHVSRYNVSAPIADSANVAIANLFKGTCAEYSPIELYLMSVLDEIDEHHPIIERLSKRGVIANFDELAALETMGRGSCSFSKVVSLTICPTMGCNFDCPYCFESHGYGKMTQEVQDDVIKLAERMLDAAKPETLSVTWFGGEPLLAPEVIESLTQRLMVLADEHSCDYSASIITNGYFLTQDIVDLLDRCKVEQAQVTVDGIGATHDATRRLANGKGTFERIIANLRDTKIPFKVKIRHNVHKDNRHEVGDLKQFIKDLAASSGNELNYYTAIVSDSQTANDRGEQVNLLCDNSALDVTLETDSTTFRSGRGHYCGANVILSVGIDEKGNLHKCWESVDKTELAYGNARDWDPANPLATASNPDNLTVFLNTALPLPDNECRECVWLPLCVGGCPYQRLFNQRACINAKQDPEAFVLALHSRIKKK